MGDGSSGVPSVIQVSAAAVAVVLGLIICKIGSGSNGNGVDMMKAPGGGGTYIPRAVFESNPQAYFSALRAGKKG
ncbi:hypothetical protein SLA2020_169420 [Shorea laevis]